MPPTCGGSCLKCIDYFNDYLWQGKLLYDIWHYFYISFFFFPQKLEKFVISCFKHADSNQYTSISLPAIGTGNLSFNKKEVASSMFKAAKKFFRDDHPSSLRCILFIIYSRDTECIQVFGSLYQLLLSASHFLYEEQFS